jgi:purine-binding chemotaxis protein CheW
MFESSPVKQHVEEHPDLDVLLFQLARETYAIPSSSVREVARYRPYTLVPGAPPTLPGIISQRGMILPVVELHPLLGFAQVEITRAARLVIVIHHDVGMALLVESVLDLVSLPISTIEPVPTALDPSRARFLRGIAQYADRAVGLLNLDELIAGLREKD